MNINSELNNITNNNRNNNSHRNLDLSSNLISLLTKGLNSNSVDPSFNWREVYYFLLGG